MHYIELVKKASSEGVLLFLKDGNLAFKLRQGANFTDELKQEIRKNKAQIISFLQGVESDKKTKIKRAEYQHNQALPLSFAQQRLWFLDRLEGDSSQYNMPAAFELSGTFNISAAETALLRIIERHEVLRTVYVEGAEGSAQVVKPFSDVKFTIQQHDLRDVSGDAQAAQVQALLQADSEQAFDLTKDVMLRAAHIVLSEEEGVLLFNMHHIASD
ncbi:condensation domain-containing protein, partial [Pseudoalteromonas sp. SMS1]|uniref:condensation domain-containing protein n=1 Tax=Pseudoalteromonas sp. SMS1 TaxID=2908894 RepID=UPI001F2FDF3D